MGMCAMCLLIGALSFSPPTPVANSTIKCALGAGASSWKPSEDERPSSDAMQLAARINTAVKTICGSNCPAIAVFRNATAANLMLVVEPGNAKLIYSPQFFASVEEGYGDPGVLALIAHEVGHALDDALGAAWIKSTWPPELRADSWAGCALARTNLRGKDLDAAFGAMTKYPAPSRPAWNLRLPAIRTGYTACSQKQAK